jgi:hypothetical protein
VPGNPGQISSHKSQDSLGNPNSPGYESWGKKGQQKDSKQAGHEAEQHQQNNQAVIEPPNQGAQFIRLSNGWEKLLLAQKKICEKAKGLFTLLEGPGQYKSQKRGKILEMKSLGCIVDLDIQQIAEEEAARAKKAAEKESA